MTRLFAAALLATVATTTYAAEPQKPAPGSNWVKVTYEVGNEGDAMTCKVLETNLANPERGQDICATILSKWKFEKSTRGETVTQYVVIKPGKG